MGVFFAMLAYTFWFLTSQFRHKAHTMCHAFISSLLSLSKHSSMWAGLTHTHHSWSCVCCSRFEQTNIVSSFLARITQQKSMHKQLQNEVNDQLTQYMNFSRCLLLTLAHKRARTHVHTTLETSMYITQVFESCHPLHAVHKCFPFFQFSFLPPLHTLDSLGKAWQYWQNLHFFLKRGEFWSPTIYLSLKWC